jgi:hypothetical protein
MIIQWILILGLLLCLFYAYLQRGKSRLVSLGISATSIAGIYFVLFPESTTDLARILGVGRGADLVLYCWIVISLVVSVNLQFKILNVQGMVTELTRELALRAPRQQEDDRATQASQADPASVRRAPSS